MCRSNSLALSGHRAVEQLHDSGQFLANSANFGLISHSSAAVSADAQACSPVRIRVLGSALTLGPEHVGMRVGRRECVWTSIDDMACSWVARHLCMRVSLSCHRLVYVCAGLVEALGMYGSLHYSALSPFLAMCAARRFEHSSRRGRS